MERHEWSSHKIRLRVESANNYWGVKIAKLYNVRANVILRPKRWFYRRLIHTVQCPCQLMGIFGRDTMIRCYF